NLGWQAFPDLYESRKICAVSAVKNPPVAEPHMVAAEAAVIVMKDASSPMMTWRERNYDPADIQGFPRVQFVNLIEPKVCHQVSDSFRHNDRLGCGDSPEGSPVEMIEMGVRYEHKVDRRQVVQRQPRTSNSLNDLQPERPDWIH